MALRVTIFEDDKDLADVLKEHMDATGFQVENVYSLDAASWDETDIVLADFRNKIVQFDDVRIKCAELNVPLLAISGMETGFVPERVKPFTIEELQSSILEAIKAVRGPRKRPAPAPTSIFAKFKRAIG
jgi:DNA-binding NtrC family response regulator